MKLLIITQILDMDDANLGFFHDWVKEFSKKFEKVIVICLKMGKHELPKNVEVFSLGKEDGESRIKYIFKFYNYIFKLINNYDSVFVHMNQIYVILGGLIWRVFNKKIGLWYAHGSTTFSLRLATFFTNIIFTSTDEGFRIKTYKKEIVGQGIKLESFPAKDTYENIGMVSVGRISRSKDYLTLIKAIALLGPDQENLIMVKIVGDTMTDEDNNYLRELRFEIKKNNLGQFFNFTGPVSYSNISKCVSGAKIFISTSLTGSLDKAIIEAMSVGLPVITCNDAAKDLYGNDYKFLLFKNSDHVELSKIIDRIRKLNKVEYLKISKHMREIASSNSLNNLIEKIFNKYVT